VHISKIAVRTYNKEQPTILGDACYKPSLLQIMTFPTESFDKKILLLDTSKKKSLSHFGQVIFDMIDFTSDFFD